MLLHNTPAARAAPRPNKLAARLKGAWLNSTSRPPPGRRAFAQGLHSKVASGSNYGEVAARRRAFSWSGHRLAW